MSDFLLRAVVGIKDDASGPAGRIGGYFANLKSKIKETEGGLASFNKHMGDLKTGMKFLAVGGAAAVLTKSLVGATLETGQLASNIKTLDVSDSGMSAIASEADKAGQSMGILKTEFLSAAYDVKSGISTLKDNELGAFTGIVAKTAKATKGSTSQMASYFGTVYNVYAKSYKDMSALDFGNMVGNMTAYAVKAYKTDGAKMQQAMESVGSAAASMGMSLQEQIVVLGSLSNTMSGGEAGTKLKSFMDKAGQAGTALGLSFTDAQGHLKPVADILDTIKGKFPDLKNAAAQAELKKALGSDEAVALVTNLADKTDALRSGISDLKESMKPGGKNFLESMASVASDNTISNTQKLDYGWQRLKETLGESIESPLNAVMSGIKDSLFWTIKFLNEHSKIKTAVAGLVSGAAIFVSLAGAIKVTTATLGLYKLMVQATGSATKTSLIPSIYNWISAKLTLSTVLWGHIKQMTIATAGYIRFAAQGIGTATIALWGYVKAGTAVAFNTMRSLITSAVSAGSAFLTSLIPAIWGAITATWSFTAALLANPITWVVVGVVALVAGIVLLAKNWDTVKAAFVGAWNSIKNAWGNAPGWFKGIVALILLPFWPFIQLGKLIINNWSGIKTFFSGLFDTVASVFTRIWEFVSNTLDSIGNKIKDAWAPLSSGLSAIGDFFFGDMSKKAEKSGKGFATGWAKGVRSNTDVVNKAVGAVMQSVSHYLPHSDAKIGPLSNLTKSGRSFVSTWTGGIDNEARSNNVVSSFINLQAKQINEKSPVVQKIASGNKTEAKNLFGNLAISVEGKDMSVNKLAALLAQVLDSELNRIGAV
jgi:TP901 family phage tail tape measure protein